MSDEQNRGRRRLYGERSPDGNEGSASSPTRAGPHSKILKGASGAAVPHGNDPTASTSRAAAVAASTQEPVGRQEGGNRKRIDRYEVVNTRPADVVSKQGKDGVPIRLQTNFFRFLTKPKWEIMHYYVDFSPDIEMVRVRCGILSEHSKLFGNGYLFDGKQLFTCVKLEKETTVVNGTSKTGLNYTITIKLVSRISPKESRFIQVLNLILRRAMKGLKLELVGRNLFDPHAKIALREYQLELWPGYETSIRQHERDILLCTEITHKVMRTETVYDILRRCSQNPARHQDEFRLNVLGLTVLTDYNNKTYRINDVDFSKTPRATFECKGKDVSFVDYYKMKYNIRIRDEHQPLLISKNKDKFQKPDACDVVVLIPELCRVTGLTESLRNNFQLMRAMSDYTRMNPERRIERLRNFNRRLQSTPESVQVLNNWNLKLDERISDVSGRIIGAQKIVFNENRLPTGEDADWTRSFRGQKMLTTPSGGLNRWAVIAPERNSYDLRTLIEHIIRTSRGLGLMVGNPREFKIQDDRTSTYIRALDDCARMDPQLILCLVPNNNLERYSSIKKRACVDRAIPTQVVTLRVVKNKGLMSIATKISIQINCKLGYTPWMIELPLSGLMTVGFDVGKCSRDRSKAYCALVATMDLQKNATYYSTVAECNPNDVSANQLWPMLAKALRQYRREQGKLPARILFYRDGVSSGSLKQLFEYEVKEIVEKLDQEYKRAEASAPPMLAYVVVNKSANVRFFAERNRNPPPGTVVDDVITLPERYDFYLVSQTVRQGSISPTSYNVVYSNIRLSPDQIQKLTYKMCHLYYNWSGTTSTPSVCQYAKKLAALVGTYLHAIPQNALEKKFYYL